MKRGRALDINRPEKEGPGKNFDLSKQFSLPPPLYVNNDRSPHMLYYYAGVMSELFFNQLAVITLTGLGRGSRFA